MNNDDSPVLQALMQRYATMPKLLPPEPGRQLMTGPQTLEMMRALAAQANKMGGAPGPTLAGVLGAIGR